MIPTTNIIQRTYHIRQGRTFGTAFAIESDGREYLITARHVVPDRSKAIHILHDEEWKKLPMTGVYHHLETADIAAIALDRQIAPRHPVELSIAGAIIGQDLLIVGFPFGWKNTQYDFNNGYPIPFVKAAILSAVSFRNKTTVTYLDGHNNAGFSGGPIVADQVPPKDAKSGPRIIGVVSFYHPERTPHPSELNPPLETMGGYRVAKDHVHPTNSGFIMGYGINHALEVIQANPCGFKLPSR